MEALLPPDLLHVDNDDNQLFNTEPEINQTAMADSLRKSLAELSIDSPLRNHANFATISAKAWEESGAMADANTEGDSATGGAITRAQCKYTRGYVRGKWSELRQRLQASGVDAPLPLEPSLTIPESFLATMMVSLPHLGEDVRKRGPPEYADFAKSVPQENPFTPASAHAGGTSQSNISQYNNGCSGSQISGDFSQLNSVHHYYHYPVTAPAAAAPPAATAPAAAPPAASAPTATAPAAAPAAAAPPSSEAQQLALREQLADIKAMFEQGLIPSREIYEDKVRQILGLE